ncbi:MAG TPA: xanthine dehydrogenase family protein subunit M [Pyrinomonadaceae bacterium]|nr:xanthine dehydrogenase family protein subunit M [Pyrinomonadaceae bacterium]
MRAYVPNYHLVTPNSLDEALSLLASEPRKWKPFAGGTDLMVLLEAGKLSHLDYVNLLPLQELRQIEVDKSHVTLGALATYTDVQKHGVLVGEFPMLCQAASETGGLAIQNRGTLGGNIMNASPAADSPPALLAYDAELELSSTKGVRWVSYNGFHTGYKQMGIRDDELLTRIRLPRSTESFFHYYRKVGTRKAQAISKVCFAGILRVSGQQLEDVRIAVGSVAPIPLRCAGTEDVLRGQTINDELIRVAVKEFAAEITPIDDIRSTKSYRLRVAQNLLADFLRLRRNK